MTHGAHRTLQGFPAVPQRVSGAAWAHPSDLSSVPCRPALRIPGTITCFLWLVWVPLHLGRASPHLCQSRWAISPQPLPPAERCRHCSGTSRLRGPSERRRGPTPTYDAAFREMCCVAWLFFRKGAVMGFSLLKFSKDRQCDIRD